MANQPEMKEIEDYLEMDVLAMDLAMSKGRTLLGLWATLATTNKFLSYHNKTYTWSLASKEGIKLHATTVKCMYGLFIQLLQSLAADSKRAKWKAEKENALLRFNGAANAAAAGAWRFVALMITLKDIKTKYTLANADVVADDMSEADGIEKSYNSFLKCITEEQGYSEELVRYALGIVGSVIEVVADLLRNYLGSVTLNKNKLLKKNVPHDVAMGFIGNVVDCHESPKEFLDMVNAFAVYATKLKDARKESVAAFKKERAKERKAAKDGN